MKVLKYVTPLVLAAAGIVFFAAQFLLVNNTPILKTPVILFTVALAACCIGIDVFIKKLFKAKLLWIWITELLLIVLPLYLWIIQ